MQKRERPGFTFRPFFVHYFMFRKMFYTVFALAVLGFSCNPENAVVHDKIKSPEVFSELIATENPLQKIAIQPFGKIDSHYLRNAKTELEAYYHCSVEILSAKELPANAYYKPRNRYKADSVISWLAKTKPESFDRVVGVTEKDISTRSEPYDDWGIMGLAYCPGESCVVSTFRLKKNADQKKIDERFAKVVLHETGHTFGLPHCRSGDTTCFMEDADGTIRSVDREKKQVCKSCQNKIPQYLK